MSKTEVKTAYWFGKNWSRFLAENYSEERLAQAETSLKALFGADGIAGKTFMDIGCGSGLFSLAAWRLGASKIVSLDYDKDSVACCRQLAGKISQDSGREWRILEGSILDQALVESLPACDIVYSWGVLHHTGDMWQAIKNAAKLVAPQGLFLIGIYNWKGGRKGTATWQKLKKWYCEAPRWQSLLWERAYMGFQMASMLARFRNPITHIRDYKRNRGMSWFRDISDWLGGYPYEAATPGEILEFVRGRFSYELIKQNIDHTLGISEFLFQRK